MKKLIGVSIGLAILASSVSAEMTKEDLIDKLADEGYERIELKTSRNKFRANAYRDEEKVRVVFNRKTGELLEAHNPNGHDIRGLQAAFVRDAKAAYDRETEEAPFGRLVSEHARSLNEDRKSAGLDGDSRGKGNGKSRGNGRSGESDNGNAGGNGNGNAGGNGNGNAGGNGNGNAGGNGNGNAGGNGNGNAGGNGNGNAGGNGNGNAGGNGNGRDK